MKVSLHVKLSIKKNKQYITVCHTQAVIKQTMYLNVRSTQLFLCFQYFTRKKIETISFC